MLQQLSGCLPSNFQICAGFRSVYTKQLSVLAHRCQSQRLVNHDPPDGRRVNHDPPNGRRVACADWPVCVCFRSALQ
jgi:hypothetical protein